MIDHGARDHATWSASATARHWQCPGALALSGKAPPDRESIHSARGTACHQISEKSLAWDTEPFVYIGEVEKTKEREITIDEELADSAAVYVDYVRQRAKPGVVRWLEQRFSLAAIEPPFDAGGTADAVIWHEADKMLEVVDLKNGVGVVEVTENPQLRTYALGALLANPKLPVDRVMVTIVQPRAHHKDGRIRSETFHVIELLEWAADLKDAMRRAKQAADEYAAVTGELTMDAWAEKWLRPGACKFCPAEGFCPALRKRAQDIVGLYFEADDTPKLTNRPGSESPEAVARDLDALDMVENWIKARRAYAHTLAEQGTEVPGYYLADTQGKRRWKDKAALVPALRKLKLSDDDIFEDPEPRSPAQIEKKLGAKRKSEIEALWERPVTGTNLVRSDRTSRPPAQSVAARLFEQAGLET